MGKIIDLTGQRFGKLTVLEFSHIHLGLAMWLCECDCGKERIVNGNRLRKGRSQSCWHKDVDDLTGKKFGKLEVLKSADNFWGKSTWFCRCDCGVELTIYRYRLTEKGETSCGCERGRPGSSAVGMGRKRKPKRYGEANKKVLFGNFSRQARYRGYSFELSENFLENAVKQNCFYCGKEPMQILNHCGTNGEFVYNGIDRKDNSVGYIESNCVPCCGICNRAKMIMGFDDFREWVKIVYHHWASPSSNLKSEGLYPPHTQQSTPLLTDDWHMFHCSSGKSSPRDPIEAGLKLPFLSAMP